MLGYLNAEAPFELVHRELPIARGLAQQLGGLLAVRVGCAQLRVRRAGHPGASWWMSSIQ